MMFLRQAAIIVVLIYVTILVAVYLLQRHLLYHPSHSQASPEDIGLANVEVIELATAPGERLIAWHAAAKGDKPTILFLHGNGGDITGRGERFQFYRAAGFGVLFLSYRGYGASSGYPTETGLIADANAAYDWLTASGMPPERIVLVGESLGTGVAIQLAAHKPVAALSLEAPFTSAADVARGTYWWLPVRLLMKDQFHSQAHLSAISVPILIVHGTDDGIIPFAMGEALHAAILGLKEFIAVPGGTHVSIFSEETWRHELDFFERHLGK